MEKFWQIIFILILIFSGGALYFNYRDSNVLGGETTIVSTSNSGTILYGSRAWGKGATTTPAFFATSSDTTTTFTNTQAFSKLALNISSVASSTTSGYKFVFEVSNDGTNFFSLATATPSSVIQTAATSSLIVVPGTIEQRNFTVNVADNLNAKYLRVHQKNLARNNSAENNGLLFVEAILK